MRIPLAVAAALAAATASVAALADESSGYTESKDTSGQVVIFKDNPLDGTTVDPNGSILQGVHRAQRMVLMRPRLNFVTELYKSIEKM
jgi:uncharacterized protein YyaL (SSP411 family)